MNEIDKLHKAELFIAVEIKRVCEKYNINYCLAYGSLLGAVRHGGFIPWDDDLDIAMPRKDYERFINVFMKETDPDIFFLENWDNEKEFGLSFSKVKLNGTVFEENSIINTKTHKGIFVDVFPYDLLPNDPIQIRKTAKKLLILGKLYKFRHNYLPTNPKNRKQVIASCFLKYISKCVPDQVLRKYLYQEEIKYNHTKTAEFATVLSGAYNCRDYFPAILLENYTHILFEGVMFKVPENYKEILSRIYGNYMQLPPKEKQVFRHNARRIDFGNFVFDDEQSSGDMSIGN